jgi:ribonuclease-3
VTRRAARGGEASDLAELERLLGHTFAQPALARQALTHRSFGTPHNERLEFLGDSLLNCAVATLLYERFPKLTEGDLSRLRAALVNQASLSEAATRLGLGERLRLGEGELKSGGFRRPSILADALEALVGAIFLDGGFASARDAVLRLYRPLLAGLDPDDPGKDPKTLLQELLQARRIGLPQYTVLATRGAAHNQHFEVECAIPQLSVRTVGSGSSRRSAEQEAAMRAFEQIRG